MPWPDRSAPRRAAIAALSICVLTSTASAQGVSFDGVVKLGVEADTNPERLNGDGSEPDAVQRFFGELALAGRTDGRLVYGTVRLGAKRFNTIHAEDAIVFDASSGIEHALIGPLGALIRLFARNRSERGHIRDYVRLGGRLGLSLRPGPLVASFGPEVSYFLYRPDSNLSYLGAGAFAQLSWAFSGHVRLGASYAYSRRSYGQAQVTSDEILGLRLNPDVAREDHGHLAGLALDLTYSFLGRLELTLQRNASNSFAKAYSRLTARATATLSLPFELWATLQVQVQRTLFDDEILIDPTSAIDDENRNAFVFNLGRDVNDWLGWEIRYNLYTQEFGGDDEDFVRHLVYGGLVATVGE